MADHIHPKVEELLKIPKIEQKTPEWYEARHNLITASDFAQALGKGKFGTQKQLIVKKVEQNTDAISKSNIFFEWGNLFEPVACHIYAQMHGVRVHEFGLLKHPRYDFFGASPDGITDEGVMLEIKCPLKRKIVAGGEVPTQYYYQIQGQLDVCDLDNCDYFECEFSRYNTYLEYVNALQAKVSKQPDETSWSGVIVDNDHIFAAKQQIDQAHAENTVYWILETYNLKRVVRDPEFLQDKLIELQKIWERITFYRTNPSTFQLEIKKTIHIDTKTINGEEDTVRCDCNVYKPVQLNGYRLVKLED